ncbi:MAG: flagellar hook-basal body protein [Candidatus Velthaea sp.]
MVRGLYAAATGALVAQANVDVIANNLANVNTSGFKRTLMQIEAAPKTAIFRDQTDPGRVPGNRIDGVPAHRLLGGLGSGSHVYDTPAIFDQGAIAQTGNNLDVALSGNGFFAVRNVAGQVRYTRDGGFIRGAAGALVTANGDAVLGADGRAVVLPLQGDVQIDRAGTLSSGGVNAGRLGIFEFRNTANLRPEGANRFIDAGAVPAAAVNTTVVQGAQEKSNSDVVRSMVDLISNERWFDANEKMIQTQDDATAIAVTTLGKTGQ